MKVGERGQVTIPKEIRDKFGIGPNTEVEFQVKGGQIILKKERRKLNLDKWVGYLKGDLKELGVESTDEFIEAIRGR